ncbi:exported hypothetical protein [Mesorhizobium plurifarium]|uniref:Uncharacterized protein n=1 Tax=Mesorhizobium plurifarium TaxID=69974 RepID=A0A090DWD3_MESPL|nr:exported hypothetical protein [Mesorhizobium plurifarium]
MNLSHVLCAPSLNGLPLCSGQAGALQFPSVRIDEIRQFNLSPIRLRHVVSHPPTLT